MVEGVPVSPTLDQNQIVTCAKTNKKSLGQFFTKSDTLQTVVSIFVQQTKGYLLEPSIGEGDLIAKINRKNIIGYEIDPDVYCSNPNVIHMQGCFFENIAKNKKSINTIVSNPPYVKWSEFVKHNTPSEAMMDVFNEVNMRKNGNLSYLFMYKAAQILPEKGEMIFLVPKDFTTATSANFLRKYLKENGNITHWMEGREDKFFDDADLENLCIFRWEKRNPESNLQIKYYSSSELVLYKQFEHRVGLYSGEGDTLFFVPNNHAEFLTKTLGDYFDVKVGSVSGKDEIFKVTADFNSPNTIELYTSIDRKEKFLFVDEATILDQLEIDYLQGYKEDLIKRYGITEENWSHWACVRNKNISIEENFSKILIPAKTRNNTPFFLADGSGFSGALYAIVPKTELNLSAYELEAVVNILNSELYKNIFSSNGMGTPNKNGVKLKLTPNSLLNIPFPEIHDIANTSIAFNFTYNQYRIIGKKVIELIGTSIFDTIKDGGEKYVDIDNNLSDDGRNRSSLLDKKFHQFMNMPMVKKAIINYVNENLEVEKLTINDIKIAKTRSWFDFSVEMNNGFIYYANTKHVEDNDSQWDNVSGNKELISYLLTGNPDSDVKSKKWEDVLSGSLISLKQSLPETNYVDYFIFEIIKKQGKSYTGFKVNSILDKGVIKVNRAQGMPGLQFNSKNAESRVITKVQAKMSVISWCQEWIDAYKNMMLILDEINEIVKKQPEECLQNFNYDDDYEIINCEGLEEAS